MNIEQTTFNGFEQAWRLTEGAVEMIVVSEVGPRILSLRHGGGKNVLFVDDGGIAREDWKIHGGHRLWFSPEAEATYHPDNTPCETRVDGEWLTLEAGVEPCGLQKVMTIGPGEGGRGFTVRHTFRNRGDMLFDGGIWALTCVAPQGRAIVPWGEGSDAWKTCMVRYWQAWAGHGSNIASPQWQPGPDLFTVEPTGEEGKVGFYSDRSWLGLLREDATFVKRTRPLAGAPYPDGGCNLELYTCGAFIELETLSPTLRFYPGAEVHHDEQWVLSDRAYQPGDWRTIEADLLGGV